MFILIRSIWYFNRSRFHTFRDKVNKVRSDLRIAAFMRIQVLCDSTLCLVVNNSRRFLDY